MTNPRREPGQRLRLPMFETFIDGATRKEKRSHTCAHTLKSTPSLCFTVKRGQQIACLSRQYYLTCSEILPLCFKGMSISQKKKKERKGKSTHALLKSLHKQERKALKGELKWHLWIVLVFLLLNRSHFLVPAGSPQNRSNEGYAVLSHGLHPDARANCIICFRINS